VAGDERLILYTNEKALRTIALRRGLDVRWGLELLIELVDVGKLDIAEAMGLAENICTRTPFPVDAILKEFLTKLQKL